MHTGKQEGNKQCRNKENFDNGGILYAVFIFIANRGNSGVIDDTYDYQYDATADTTCVTVDKDGDKTVMRRIK